MEDEKIDVKEEEKETPSDPSAEENEVEDSVEESEEDFEESEEEDSEEEEESDDEDTEDEELKKKDEQIANLNKALAEERGKTRKVNVAPEPRTATSPVSKDEDPISKKLVAANEREALKKLYSDFPDLAPENDPGNELFNQFQRGYKVLVEAYGIDVPITVDEIYSKGREVMNVLKPSTSPSPKVVKDTIKADMANVGGSSSTKKESKHVTSSDKRAAAAAEMSIDEYMKHKDSFEVDDIPI